MAQADRDETTYGAWEAAARRSPKIVYLPLQCSTEGCHRFPWATVDDVPYCKPHGDAAIELSRGGSNGTS